MIVHYRINNNYKNFVCGREGFRWDAPEGEGFTTSPMYCTCVGCLEFLVARYERELQLLKEEIVIQSHAGEDK